MIERTCRWGRIENMTVKNIPLEELEYGFSERRRGLSYFLIKKVTKEILTDCPGGSGRGKVRALASSGGSGNITTPYRDTACRAGS